MRIGDLLLQARWSESKLHWRRLYTTRHTPIFCILFVTLASFTFLVEKGLTDNFAWKRGVWAKFPSICKHGYL